VGTTPFDLDALLARVADAPAIHHAHLNHQLVSVLELTGFDRRYVRADGCLLYDDEGRDYLDFLAGFGVFALGRNHPVVKDALVDALDRDLAHLVQFDTPLLAGLLAEELVNRAGGGLSRCFFGNSGAEANETAIKLARRHTGHSRIVYCDHAFHGLTTGALALNGGAEFREGFEPLLPGTAPVPFGDLEALEAELRRGDVAAFVIEPIQGKTVEIATPSYLRGALELCHQHGALLVIDEVQTGLGRTGELFCYQHAGIEPDLVTMAKALSAGFIPVGATLCRDDIWRSTYSSLDRAMVHSSTFGQNTLAAVAGHVFLHVLDEEDLLSNARRTGALLTNGIKQLAGHHDMISDVRGLGLMIGIEFDQPSAAPGKAAFRLLQAMRHGLFSQMVVGPLFNDHRILTQVAADDVNIVKLLPPLVAGPAEVERFVTALDDVLRKARHMGTSTVRLGRDFATRGLKARRKHKS
jgi:ornithine--oxo-acid transaminase